ncbi:hypothetical protein TREPR_0090 [Treponema primitia ZAS-2]|uniref:Uncharacterized protein n=1 Tax=Treponema primitia (strain ATCC BAA-887 / DSM 12427 / ZAS-2) TaxID=545694 RepID=F5YNA5_TREPZ|nr:hypothetical protein TREPR_0090 [Treponema primitia ZAS-2]
MGFKKGSAETKIKKARPYKARETLSVSPGFRQHGVGFKKGSAETKIKKPGNVWGLGAA